MCVCVCVRVCKSSCCIYFFLICFSFFFFSEEHQPQDSDSEEEGDSDEEEGEGSHLPRWRNVHNSIDAYPDWQGQLPKADDILSPLQYLRKFFSEDIFEVTVEEYNLYAIQCDPNKPLNLITNELEQFLGTVVYILEQSHPSVQSSRHNDPQQMGSHQEVPPHQQQRGTGARSSLRNTSPGHSPDIQIGLHPNEWEAHHRWADGAIQGETQVETVPAIKAKEVGL